MYKDYLKSFHWMKTKMHRLFKRCYFCGAKKNLVVHHRRYKSKKGKSILFKEGNSDLFLICSDCHMIWHEVLKLEVKSVKFYKLCRHFTKIDGLKKAINFLTSHNLT